MNWMDVIFLLKNAKGIDDENIRLNRVYDSDPGQHSGITINMIKSNHTDMSNWDVLHGWKWIVNAKVNIYLLTSEAHFINTD